jgi:hypothetical protein
MGLNSPMQNLNKQTFKTKLFDKVNLLSPNIFTFTVSASISTRISAQNIFLSTNKLCVFFYGQLGTSDFFQNFSAFRILSKVFNTLKYYSEYTLSKFHIQ